MGLLRMHNTYFVLLPGGPPAHRLMVFFSDKPDLHLSFLQRDIFAGWKRPHELLEGHADETGAPLVPVMTIAGKTDLVQDVLTDCSVVASLCATTSRTERGLDEVRKNAALHQGFA
jgi:hypothetical protein